jgi:hypothetical protein
MKICAYHEHVHTSWKCAHIMKMCTHHENARTSWKCAHIMKMCTHHEGNETILIYEGHSKSNASYLFPWKIQYSNVATIVSNALKPIFSSVHSSLVVIRWFTWMSWSRQSSFRGVTAVHGRLERGLPSTSLSSLLKRLTNHHTVRTSTVWSL